MREHRLYALSRHRHAVLHAEAVAHAAVVADGLESDGMPTAVAGECPVPVEGHPLSGAPNTARGRRRLELDQGTVATLREHWRRQLEERFAFGPDWTDSGYVFTTQAGGALNPDGVSKLFKRACARLKLPPIRLQVLRHTAASLMLAAGENPRLVSERLGHSTPAFTLHVYAHVHPGEQRAAAERLARLVGVDDSERSFDIRY